LAPEVWGVGSLSRSREARTGDVGPAYRTAVRAGPGRRAPRVARAAVVSVPAPAARARRRPVGPGPV